MEKVKRLVNEIAYTPTQDLQNLSRLHLSLIPLLSFTSSLYRFALFARQRLYHLGLFSKHRLPVPVISVGNLTWGGNGKTPMVEFIARFFTKPGISPLILTRGYAGGDEVAMLQRHLVRTSVKIGVGANRAATAACFLERYGFINMCIMPPFEKLGTDRKFGNSSDADKIGVVILDDGMQHWSLLRDLEIVMVNGMVPWGNNRLFPRGPLREPLTALGRADIAVIHHADLVSDKQLKAIESTMREVKENLPIFFTTLSPSYFFEVKNYYSKLSLRAVHNMVVLCVSAIGFANAFVQGIEKIGPSAVDRLDFSDHHFIQAMDIKMIKERLRKLEEEFGVKPIVVVTEKDYYRDPVILKELDNFEVLVLCSSMQIMPFEGRTEESFNKLLTKLIKHS
ncbi:tetraacyldisaccharide 4'-kinase family protein isoform X2 [Tasmannia lanceolata]|uniref:tetraacyldisaccharide 4'-kinase family protein isoform X2 n=1 Tax=Tasmannia lanceolata TaxID=3420 RepID=UPI004062E7BC